jgi:hypothetical protein
MLWRRSSGVTGAAGGHPGLAGALIAATEQGTKDFLDIGAAYTYTSSGLASGRDDHSHIGSRGRYPGR